MSQSSLDRVLCSPNLPTLPVVAMRVLELTAKPDVSLREIAAVIENDPAIAAKVIRTVNSSYYSLNTRCGSIHHALAFLGLQTVKALVLGFSLAHSIDGGGDDEVSFDFLSYWRRSIYTAAAAREIALLHRRCDPDESFTASIVQDLGMVALWRAFGDRYLQVVDLARNDHRRLIAMEIRTFEIDHASVSAAMLSRWHFPDKITEAVRCHHRSHEASMYAAALARTLELAGIAANVLTQTSGENELARFRQDGQEWFDLRPAPMTLLLQRLTDRANDLSTAFKLDIGVTPDVDAILESAARIKREQRLVEPALEADGCELFEHGSVSLAAIPDAGAFGDALQRTFRASSRHAGVGVILLGIDRARAVQTGFGARAVEAAMLHAIRSIREVAPSASAIFRFVGAELAVIVPETEIDDLCRVAEVVRRDIALRPVPFEQATEHSFPTTVSIGVAIYDPSGEVSSGSGIETPDQLVRGAMFALANARRIRNRVIVFRRDLKPETEQH